MRQPLLPALTEGPMTTDHLGPLVEAQEVVGGMTIYATESPYVVPIRAMPEPHPIAHRLIPFMISHRYGHPYLAGSHLMGRLRFPSPQASVQPQSQRAYRLRTNYRRPSLVKPGDLEP